MPTSQDTYVIANTEYQKLKQFAPVLGQEGIITNCADKYLHLYNALEEDLTPNEDAIIAEFGVNYDNCYSYYWDLIEQNEQTAYGNRVIVCKKPFVISNAYICKAVCYATGKSDSFWQDVMEQLQTQCCVC